MIARLHGRQRERGGCERQRNFQLLRLFSAASDRNEREKNGIAESAAPMVDGGRHESGEQFKINAFRLNNRNYSVFNIVLRCCDPPALTSIFTVAAFR